ncbi:type III effector [Brenneria izadpanahii]|uniref:Type III effector n=1 Tax=Brenneria izadpanahii TaxID=2722756 RepID=A0ABX7UZD3_9GAMM|nr:hypothetical protein [Brenneria izadpanahii]QTF09515.1 type III effector [Brenneria izadpanahii]
MLNATHNRYFPGRVTVNPLENFSSERTVKLHDAASAQELGIGAYEGKRVSVSASTMEHLQLAQEALRKVKMLLPYGAGNQTAEVLYTGGESMARTYMVRRTPFSSPIQAAWDAARHQSGNCQEFASVSYTLLAQQSINAPVSFVKDQNWCHAYVLIGDPRDQTWGEKNTVVVDPWVRYPSAVTLQESKNRTPALPALYQRPPNAAPLPAALTLNHIKHVTSGEVANYLRQNQYPPIGRSYIQLNDYYGVLSSLLDERLVAKDPSTRYSSDALSARSMDDIAQATVSRQRAAQQAWDDSPY